jgi:cell cycle checkpoint protein
VPPKKLEALCAWLDAASPSRTLVLVGPPGCSKSSAVRVLAHERGYDVHEWTPPTPTLWSEHAHLASSFTEVEYSSKVDEFCAFVARATKYTPLSFLVNSADQQQKKKKKTVLLIRDIPSSDEAGRARILESLRTLACTSQSPCAVILTEQDDGGGQSNARGGELMNREVRGVMESAGAICVNFNPVT